MVAWKWLLVMAGAAGAVPPRMERHRLAMRANSLPASFNWSSSAPLIGPKNDNEKLTALKDPSVVNVNGTYHVFTTAVKSSGGYSLAHLSFTDFSQANAATFNYLDQTAIGPGSYAAPQVFFFQPQNLWYLVFQTGNNAAYSTNRNINDPSGWSAPKNFFDAIPPIISQNKGAGGWVDMWVICDAATCYLFSSDDNGHLYRASTPLSSFPNGMGNVEIALSDTKNNLFEASNVYAVGNGQYLLIVEAIGSDGLRYFRSWSSNNLGGAWTPLAATEQNPFARSTNTAFMGSPWTKSISHGEAVRTNPDQTLSLRPCNIQYLYQGVDPAATGDYNALPWKLGLLTQTNGAC